MQCSGWGVRFDARRGSSPCCFIDKHQGLEDDASFDWKPVECAEDRCDMGELRKVEHKAGCAIMDKLQGFDGTSGEPSQQRVALV
jgi:hypothetical protein